MMATPQQTLLELNQLSLRGMAESYSAQLSQPKLHEIPFDDRFAMLVDAESRLRERRRLDRMIKKAEFPEKAVLEELDEAVPRALDKKLLRTLVSCEWVNQNQNVILTGPAGIGC
jgi:DNA replication protein DnaC